MDQAIETGRGVRGLLSTPASRADVGRLLALAGRAPSGSNIQPWSVHVVTGAALRRLTDDLTAAHFAGEPETREYEYYPLKWRSPYIDRRRKLGWQLFSLAGVARGGRVAGQRQLSRRGDAMARTALYEAAHSLLTGSAKWPALRAWGTNVAKHRGMARARVAVARKVAAFLHRGGREN